MCASAPLCLITFFGVDMDKDDIIRMAREAGGQGLSTRDFIDIERFATLVAAAEREACAKVCQDKAKQTFSSQCQTWGDYFANAIRARSQQ